MSNEILSREHSKGLEIVSELAEEHPQYREMMSVISQSQIDVSKSTDNFNKTQSQFMDNLLTVSHPTPLRNVRQILAEIKKVDMAMREAYFGCKKKEIEIRIKERDAANSNDELKTELLLVEADELRSQLKITKGFIGGAIRKIANYIEQYQAILKSAGKESFTEEDFENEEERYHIMKAFDQGVTAARSNGGRIDEGNMIYLTQLGVNGATAQRYVSNYLSEEQKLLDKNVDPGILTYYEFLKSMADRFSKASNTVLKAKGMREEISRIATLRSVTSERAS